VTRVVVVPFRVASNPRAAGHFWVYATYVDALRRMGCDVWWLEELPASADPRADETRIGLLVERLRPLGLAEQLILFRSPAKPDQDHRSPTYLNVEAGFAERVLSGSDLLINFHYELPPALLVRVQRTALLDIDPGMLQLWWASGELRVHPHDVYFSIGENLGRVPGHGEAQWLHTPPAVSLHHWRYQKQPARGAYTSVSSWRSRSYVTLNGELRDSNKSVSYLEYIDLPRRTRQALELVTSLSDDEAEDRQLLESHGWRVRDAEEAAPDPYTYRSYIQSSRGEFGLAKPAYVSLGNAWFSDRTVCYLASGRPAVVQNTGPSSFLSDGLGLVRFSSVAEAIAALDEVEGNYTKHSRAARELAETYFSAPRVVRRLLDRALDRSAAALG
jgi:hypothetical protein